MKYAIDAPVWYSAEEAAAWAAGHNAAAVTQPNPDEVVLRVTRAQADLIKHTMEGHAVHPSQTTDAKAIQHYVTLAKAQQINRVVHSAMDDIEAELRDLGSRPIPGTHGLTATDVAEHVLRDDA